MQLQRQEHEKDEADHSANLMEPLLLLLFANTWPNGTAPPRGEDGRRRGREGTCPHAKSLQLYPTLCNPMDGTVAWQAPLPVGLSRQKYWSGLPCPPPEDLPNPGIKYTSLMSSALAGGFFVNSATWEALGRERKIVKKKNWRCVCVCVCVCVWFL